MHKSHSRAAGTPGRIFGPPGRVFDFSPRDEMNVQHAHAKHAHASVGMAPNLHSYGVSNEYTKRKALTLVEILVVIVIITILASALVVATSSVINKARTTNTLAVLQVVADAVESFKREQQEKPTITRAVHGQNPDRVFYKKRYGLYPPDELEVFTSQGLPGSVPLGGSLAGQSSIIPSPENVKWGAMRFYNNGNVEEDALEHRDLLAMILTIELYSESGAAILSRLPDRNRTPGPIDPITNIPTLFLDRPSSGPPNQAWDDDDFQIRYIVDGWGVPIGYLAQRDYDEDDPTKTISTNHPEWNEASTEIIRLNRGQPLILSYGPNGKDQLTKEWMEIQPGSSTSGSILEAKASVVGDFKDDDHMNHPLNQDNVYLDPSLKERLAKRIDE